MNLSVQDVRPENFDPVPYTFRIPEKWKKAGETCVLSPPNWLLLDHTIAVVWSLFSSFSPAKALDIDDLKWAHEYLKEVRNPKGENPPDVKTCLTVIQDRLIGLYAQLTRKEGPSPKRSDPSTASENESITVVKPPEEPIPSEEVFNDAVEILPPKSKPKRELTKSETNATRRAPPSRESPIAQKSGINIQKRVIGTPFKSTPTPAKRIQPIRKEVPKKQDGDAKNENFFTEVFQRNKNSDRILGSHNLSKKKTNAAIQITLSNEDISESDVKNDSIQSRSDDGKISLQFKKWITAEEINNEEEAYRKLKNEIKNLTRNPKISKDEVMKFLSNWRKEQVERLQSELKRLNSIEAFMKSFKMDGFVPYVTADLAQKLESMTDKKELNKSS